MELAGTWFVSDGVAKAVVRTSRRAFAALEDRAVGQ